MNDVFKEYETYLQSLVDSYNPARTSVINDPSTLPGMVAKTRDFQRRADEKIAELQMAHPELPNLKTQLSAITVRYYSKVTRGHL